VKVQLLGTAAADGWPNPFCECPSCESLRLDGVIRAQSAALIDDRLLLECGPDLPRSAERHHVLLNQIEHLIVTHGHWDHCSGIPLIIRQWAKVNSPLNVIAPSMALRSLQHWVSPDSQIEWIEAVTFRPIALGDYVVVPLLANHEAFGESGILPLVTDGDSFVLWATDTGPLPEETIRALRSHPLDLVFLDETWGNIAGPHLDHLNLNSFGEAVSQLRDCGAITDKTHIAPIHLSHRNPSVNALQKRLRDMGARLPFDGDVIRL
jgi:adenosylcobinamide kinase/adenosylcobinamide-phosphate guanylyltransferase